MRNPNQAMSSGMVLRRGKEREDGKKRRRLTKLKKIVLEARKARAATSSRASDGEKIEVTVEMGRVYVNIIVAPPHAASSTDGGDGEEDQRRDDGDDDAGGGVRVDLIYIEDDDEEEEDEDADAAREDDEAVVDADADADGGEQRAKKDEEASSVVVETEEPVDEKDKDVVDTGTQTDAASRGGLAASSGDDGGGDGGESGVEVEGPHESGVEVEGPHDSVNSAASSETSMETEESSSSKTETETETDDATKKPAGLAASAPAWGGRAFKDVLQGCEEEEKATAAEAKKKKRAKRPEGSAPGMQRHCELCDVKCSGDDAWENHIVSKGHAKCQKRRDDEAKNPGGGKAGNGGLNKNGLPREPKERKNESNAYISGAVSVRYANQVITAELNDATQTCVAELKRFQDRLYFKDPIKAKMRRRLVFGLREVTKGVQLEKAKCVIVAPNIEETDQAGGLDDVIGTILEEATNNGTPVVFALTRNRLGKIVGGARVRVSALAVLDYSGAEDMFHGMIKTAAACRAEYKRREEAIARGEDPDAGRAEALAAEAAAAAAAAAAMLAFSTPSLATVCAHRGQAECE